MKKFFYVFFLIGITILFSSCDMDKNANESNISSPTHSPQIQDLNIPNKENLIEIYTSELKKITNSTIESSSFENYEDSDTDISLDVITQMSDSKKLRISLMYIKELTDSSWSLISIKNFENERVYYVPEDMKAYSDMYDYNSDILIAKEDFQDTYTLNKVNFVVSSNLEKDSNSYKFFTHDRNRMISIFTSETAGKSLDEIWEMTYPDFSNYSLDNETTLKIGEKTGKQWKFSFDNGNSTPYQAVMTMVPIGKKVYCFYVCEKFILDSFVYEQILKSITWNK